MNMKSKQRNKTEARNSVSVAFTSEGWEDYCHWKDADSDVFATINTLIRECLRTPFKGTGKPEPLKPGMLLDADVLGERRALSISPLASTRMACPDGADEAAFAEAIESTTHYEMDGPMLLLLSNGDLKAVFQAKPAKSE